jgi:hypothetical protein
LKDKTAFMAQLVDGGPPRNHPLFSLQEMAGGTEERRAVLFSYFFGQTGLTGRAAEVVMEMSDLIMWHGILRARPDRDLSRRERVRSQLSHLAEEFFDLVPRKQRVRVYRVSEKMAAAAETALSMAQSHQYEVTPGLLERGIPTGSFHLYLDGMCRGRDRATAAKIRQDFADAVDLYLSYMGRPVEISGNEWRERRQRIVRGARPFEF